MDTLPNIQIDFQKAQSSDMMNDTAKRQHKRELLTRIDQATTEFNQPEADSLRHMVEEW